MEQKTDIKTAKITQHGQGVVELSMALYEPVPAEPPWWVAYNWGFEKGFTVTVVWRPLEKKWYGQWVLIQGRQIVLGDPVEFRFSDETVRARVNLGDLLKAVKGEELNWHAAVRRLTLDHPIFTNTVPVDRATDEPLGAIWVPR